MFVNKYLPCIIPEKDANNQFFLSCFQVSESRLYSLSLCGLSMMWREFERRSFNLYCQQVPTWIEVHTLISTTENISLQESRTGVFSTVDPTAVHSEVASVSDKFSQDDHFQFDIDDLKDQLGIDHIMRSLYTLNEKPVELGGVASLPELGNTVAKSDTVDSVFARMLFLTQGSLLRSRKFRHPHREPTVQNSLTQACFYPRCLRKRRTSVLTWLLLLLSE